MHLDKPNSVDDIENGLSPTELVGHFVKGADGRWVGYIPNGYDENDAPFHTTLVPVNRAQRDAFLSGLPAFFEQAAGDFEI
jgi:hypothetical protein